MFCNHKHSYVVNMAWYMHAQFIKNIPSMYHAKALVPFSPNFKWRYATWLLFTHNCWGIVVNSWKFSFFFTMYPLFIVGKKPGGQMTVLYLLTKYLQTFYFFFLFLMSQLQFPSPTKNVLQLFTTLQIAFDISLAT